MSANINPDLKPNVDLGKFRFWCQKVLPLVYDDSISYYEVLGKMVVYLNQVIEDVNNDSDNILTLRDAFLELQQYVNDAIQYDVSDLEEAVRTAIDNAEIAETAAQQAVSSAESAQTSATSASVSASGAEVDRQSANQSAINASTSASTAIEMANQASGYATSANQSAINAAGSALNAVAMADQCSDYSKVAEGYAVGKQNGVDVDSNSDYYHNNAKYYSDDAGNSADSADHFKDEANTSALFAEGISVGKQDGVDVDSSSPYYHNNAKYYAEQAGQASGLSVSLVSLTDTEIQNPSNGQVLAYDSTDQKWKNSDEVEGVTSLENLTDTNISNPTDDQLLSYDATSGKWVNSTEKEIIVSPTAPSDVGTKLWIQSTEQTPVQIPTVPELNSIVSELNASINNKVDRSEVNDDLTEINQEITLINNTLNNKANTSDVNTSLNLKADKANVISQSAPSSITLADNTEYYLTNISALNFSYPVGNFECWIKLQTVTSGAIAINFPTSQYIGKIPTFGSGESWEVSIKNGVIIAGQIT